jgi:hypothetical protein
MKNDHNPHDFDRLVQEARMQRSVALATAIAGLAQWIWRGGERVVEVFSRTPRPAKPEHFPL